MNYAGRGLQYDQEGDNRNLNMGLATEAERVALDPMAPKDADILPGARDVAAPDGPSGDEGRGYIWDGAARAGISVRHELQRAGVATDAPLSRQPVKASFEVHIEQGPVLEQKAKTIGVVTGVQHMSRHEVVVEGQEAHAGPTPMDMRRDPIRVLADLLPALYAATEQRGRDARLTFGFIETLPGSPNTVPGRLRFTVDIRHPDAQQYAALREEMNRLVHAALQRHALAGDIRCVWEAPGVSFDPTCVAAVRSATAALGFNSLEMVSGAGHDSCNVSAVVPTAMVFVPCAGGLSHNEAESALPGDLEAGANVLLHAMLSLATSVTSA